MNKISIVIDVQYKGDYNTTEIKEVLWSWVNSVEFDSAHIGEIEVLGIDARHWRK